MNDHSQDVLRYLDENARDEFSAAHIFKNNQMKTNNGISGQALIKKSKNVLADITNDSFAKNKLNLKSTLTNKMGVLNVKNEFKINKPYNLERCITDKTNTENNVLSNKFGLKRNRKDQNINEDDTVCLNYIKDEKIIYPYSNKRSKSFESTYNLEKIEPVFKNFDETSNEKFAGSILHALTTPANGLNNHYKNAITVAVDCPYSTVKRVREGSVAWKTMKETSKIEKRIILTSSRKFCSPREQFVVTENNQYQSKCLIDSYLKQMKIKSPFNKSFDSDGIKKYIRKFSHSKSLMTGNINTSHFHDLHLEQLPCNKSFDFMRTSKQLTGSILGGFVNDIFELSNFVYLPSEVIHSAVDLIYGYLSRVHDVPLVDMRWITLGAVWIAAKNDGLNILLNIKDFADCRNSDLQQAELRMLHVIDFNVTKPHAFNFRNRFLLIEKANSTILHLSSFTLEMSLHSYTLMLHPASKRAAAAMWLARLIDTFSDVRFNDEIWNNMEAAIEKMDSVWPNHFVQLTGYYHQDISLLALQMHVIIIAFISSDEKPSTKMKIHPSVSACHKKYSSIKYGELTTSYEKFTARTVYYASELYCMINNLQLSSWMEKNEFEILLEAFKENKCKLQRSTSNSMFDIDNERSSNSCPELITLSHSQSKSPHKITDENYQLFTVDSGYDTLGNE